jgi:DNA invertase Pin-like site-specific DNA recombinase
VRAGLENARQRGKCLGRPRLNNDILEKARILRNQGLSFRRIEKDLGVGEGTIRKRL